ncbi:hypothetical protein [Xenorhabdus bovienii]|uniref:hypothetical protein n=1 Tax=Xenorhabdus bovienii TaxID=40576 RepID=UPI0023B2E083|nr:hypothetical protein [Xenorhabdus bovienii]MDE9454750.1 hypothetical protein [Xenorhabdus bovienii]MDE9462381.1 hypothetical protein [Xenorhabdus bovienii]MDE9469203.1 hypothetical protein [Xenorhabdus bovienii]MDE9548975.1 hypothetical protein [Xenorhabdus bovienii]
MKPFHLGLIFSSSLLIACVPPPPKPDYDQMLAQCQHQGASVEFCLHYIQQQRAIDMVKEQQNKKEAQALIQRGVDLMNGAEL